jgi:hypothetical protein
MLKLVGGFLAAFWIAQAPAARGSQVGQIAEGFTASPPG